MTSNHEALNAVLRQSGVSKTIYSLVMPETEAVIDDILGDTGGPIRNAFHDSYREAWTQKQDAMHEAFFETWKHWSRPIVEADWDRFPFMYPTAGASEGLREAIYAYGARARVEGFLPQIHAFVGEYEGFAAYASAAGIPVTSHNRRTWRACLERIGPTDQFYLSHPSAIDGNVWPEFDAFASALHDAQPTAELMLDLTYVGCIARPFRVRADHPNIPTVFFSLSKPAGVYYHRIGGVLSRTAYPGLFGNIWFKSLMALRVGTEVMKRHGVHDLPKRYSVAQASAIDHANRRLGLALAPSDVFLLGTMPPRRDPTDLERYLTRGSQGEELVRVCLTPTMAHDIDTRIDPTVRARPHEGLERDGRPV